MREGEARRIAAAEAQRPFDLSRGPLLRVSVLRLGSQRYLLLLVLHHIISDAWSMEILIREWTTLYQDLAAGEPARLPSLPIQYADFAAWQRARLQGSVLADQLAYWKQQLSGAPQQLELPTDRPRPPIQSFRGAEQEFEVSLAVVEKLETLAHETSTTLFMVLLAGFQVLLARYSTSSFTTQSPGKRTSDLRLREYTPLGRWTDWPYGIYERGAGTAGSICLDASELHHLAPLLGFVGDHLSKVGRSAGKHRAA